MDKPQAEEPFEGLPEDDGADDSTGVSRQLGTSVSHLEAKVEKLEDKIREYQFLTIFLAVLVFDCVYFPIVNNTAAILCIFGLEVGALLVLAKRFGIDEIEVLADKAMSVFRKNNDS